MRSPFCTYQRFRALQREEWEGMHISFNNVPSSNVDKVTTGYQSAAATSGKAAGGYALDISGTVTDNTAYGIHGSKGIHGSQGVHGRTAEEVMQAAAGSEDIALYRNYMTVMSNSMSDEDFARLQEEGYHPSDMDLETAVTIVDTIKAELVKAGVDIVGYTDSLDMDQLAAITGSVSFAESLVKAFAMEDVPVTQENVEQTVEAFSRGKELTELSEGAMKYMVTNEMEPDIDSLYLAEHAGAVDADRQGKGYFAEELPGYYGQKASDADLSGLQEQVEKIIEKAGYPVTEETVKDGFWLIEKGVPLTEESFCRMEEVKEVSLPATEGELLEAIAGALAEGHSAGEANLADPKSIYRKAADCLTAYEKEYEEALLAEPTPENIKARRQLEEIRLHMTLEANAKLLRSGFSIDTAPMEETIDALKALEEKHTGQANAAYSLQEPVALCQETVSKVREIPYLPAVSLGRILSQGQPLTVDTVYEAGKQIQDIYKQAGEAYETMMTTPRRDMGDSIKTAFRNVDELLVNMGQELTEDNRKAVRSISYNHMELTEENLLAVKGADKVVQRVVEKMTPSAVLSMIREGINPLKTSMEELDTYLAGREDYTEDSEKYSRFLYQLEKSKDITEEEKESFIGIYRLLRQIEKSDGAAVGNLVSSRAEINFANLLSAVRTGRVKGVDISVNEDFGGLTEAVEKGISIDAQIEKAYSQSLLAEIRNMGTVSDEAIYMLKQLEQPVTIDNLLAADALRQNGAKPFKKLAEAEKAVDGREGSFTGIEDEENAFTDRDSFEKAYDELLTRSEALAKELTFGEGMHSVDVRAMQLVCKQLHIQGLQAKREEEYNLPEMIDGEVTAIHLKLVHDTTESGKISVGMETVGFGHLTGEFSMDSGSISGYFAGTGKEAAAVLEKAAAAFLDRIQAAGLRAGSIQVIEGSTSGSLAKNGGMEEETKELYKVAGMMIGALKEVLAERADGSKL